MKSYTILKYILGITTLVTLSIIFFVFGYILFKGIRVISISFILDAPSGMPLGTSGGVKPAIIGSLISGLISTVIGGIIGIFSSILITFYKGWFSRLVKICILLMSSIPSILFGLFTYVLFIYYFKLPKSLLSASIALSFMAIPFIEIRAEKNLIEKGIDIMTNANILGISKEYAIYKIIIPYIITDLVMTLALSMSYTMGATAPIMYTGAVLISGVPNNIFEPFMSLPYHLYILVTNGYGENYAYATAFVLYAMLLIIQILVRLTHLIKKKITG